MTATAARPVLRGLTLIELLAVVVLIGLAAGAVVFRTAAVHEDLQLRSAADALRNLDHRARTHAQRGHRLLLRIQQSHDYDASQESIVLIEVASERVLERIDLPKDTGIAITREDEVAEVVFDRSGRTPDYQVSLTRGPHVITWRVRGQTGEPVRQEIPS